MPAYRLRDVAVIIGAVVVGAAAGFNGGWLAAVPPKIVTVDTPNKLATGNADIRTPLTTPAPEPQATPAIQATEAPAAAEATPQPDVRNVRVTRPVEQANEISTSAQQAVAPSAAQAVPAQPPAENKAVRVIPNSPPPTPVPQSPAAKPEAPAQAASTESDVPRTTGQGERRKSDANSKSEDKNKSDVKSKSDSKSKPDADKPDAKKRSQTASDQKARRKDAKRQDADSAETATAETGSREVRSDPKKNKKTIVQKTRRKELRREDVDSDDEAEVVESERRPVTTGRSFRREQREDREEYERVPADRARGRVVIERERAPREVEIEEPRQGFGLFDFFGR
jgi:hypothetical protein